MTNTIALYVQLLGTDALDWQYLFKNEFLNKFSENHSGVLNLFTLSALRADGVRIALERAF